MSTKIACVHSTFLLACRVRSQHSTENSKLRESVLNMNDERSACPGIVLLGSPCKFTIELNFPFTFEKISLPETVSAADLARGENNLHAIVATEIRFGLVSSAGSHSGKWRGVTKGFVSTAFLSRCRDGPSQQHCPGLGQWTWTLSS